MLTKVYRNLKKKPTLHNPAAAINKNPSINLRLEDLEHIDL